MSGSTNVLREFLVNIRYHEDVASQSRAITGLEKVTKTVGVLYAAVESVAVGITYAVARVATGMEQLFYASQRLRSSAEDIQAYSFAIGQLGGTADGARSSLEALASRLMFNPGYGGMLQRLGVDPSGGAVNTMTQLAGRFRQMPLFQAHAYAGALGIDDTTLLAMIRGVGQFSAAYHDMYRKAGLDSRQAGNDAKGFMQQLRLLETAFDVLYQKIGAQLMKGLGEQIKSFRLLIVGHFDQIAQVIEQGARFLLMIAEALGRMIMRGDQAFKSVLAWFHSLSPEQQKSIKIIGDLVAAWTALNLVLNMSPIALIATLAATIGLLYDDYKTWKEGGKSLIDWAKWEPAIKAANKAIQFIIDLLVTLVSRLQDGWKALSDIADIVATAWGPTMKAAFNDVKDVVDGLITRIENLLGLIDETKSAAADKPVGPSDWFTTWVTYHAGLAGTLPQAAYDSPVDEPGSPEGGNPNPGGTAKSGVAYLMSKYGLTRNAASGIIANLQAESRLNPGKVGDNGKAYGIEQWHPDRRSAIEHHFGKRLQQMTFFEQLDAAIWEARSGSDPGAQRALQLIQQGTLGGEIDPAQAATYWSLLAERSKDPNKDTNGVGDFTRQRMALARSIAASTQANITLPKDRSPTTISQTNNITVHGANDPTGVAVATGKAVGTQNQRLVRNVQGAVQ